MVPEAATMLMKGGALIASPTFRASDGVTF